MKNFKRVLSLALAVMMVIGGLVLAPVATNAESAYTKVTSVSEITAGGNFVLVAEYNGGHYALGTAISGKITANEITVTDGVPTGENIPVWTIAATTNGVSLSNGSSYLAYAGSSTNFAEAADTSDTKAEWTVTLGADNAFRFVNVSNTGRGIAYQYENQGSPASRFGAYAVSNDQADSGYVFGFTIYKYSGSLTPPPQDIELEADATPEEIVNAAYEAAETGVDVVGKWELTGVITAINTAFSSQFNNITVTMQIGDMEDKPMMCYRLTVEDPTDADALAELEELGVGDTITVYGEFGAHNGRPQYAAGSILTDVVKAAAPKEDIELDAATATEEDIVNAAYQAMADGVDFLGEWELTGVISSIDTEWSDQYGNITVTMIVGDMTENPIQCFRLAVADDASDELKEAIKALAVGETITVKGTFGYYNGKVQYNQGSVLTAVGVVEEAPDTGDYNVIGAYAVLAVSALALVVVEFKKRR